MATATVNAISRTQAPGFYPAPERRTAHSPYGLPIVDNCVACKLRNGNSFCALSEATTQDLNNLKHVSSYPESSVVFLEGQDARGVYVLCQGRAKLTTTNADGKSMILKIAEPGTILGLHACISRKPYEVTVETLQPAQLAFIRREDFLHFLNQHPDACLHAAQHLARDCQSAYEVIRSIGLSHSVSEKLARLLLQWSTDGRVVDGTVRLKLALTHEEMAQLIGTSRETVTRTLSDFKKQHVLEVNGSTLVIRNKAGLERLVAS
ncbi:MAG TPA: Crp/Fnr family transcriptional regulator [Terriglobales bacterium]|nr:Crp/Fnr family transcriptional regulator [Terriglobales bacterium]